MSNEFSLKIQHYADKLKEHENKEDFDIVLQIIKDYQNFLEGVLALNKNEMDRRYLLSIYTDLNLLRRVIKLSNDMKKKDDENNSDFNNLKGRVKRLEERFDKLDSLK